LTFIRNRPILGLAVGLAASLSAQRRDLDHSRKFRMASSPHSPSL
jgi:hypothetical protein